MIRTNYSAEERQGRARTIYPPEGEYPASVSDAWEACSRREREAAEREGRPPKNNMLVVQFSIHGPGATVDRRAYFLFEHTDKMARLMDALKRSGDGATVEADELVGRPCRVVVKHELNQSKGRTFAEVAQVLPPSRAANVPQQIEDDDVPF